MDCSRPNDLIRDRFWRISSRRSPLVTSARFPRNDISYARRSINLHFACTIALGLQKSLVQNLHVRGSAQAQSVDSICCSNGRGCLSIQATTLTQHWGTIGASASVFFPVKARSISPATRSATDLSGSAARWA